MRQTDQALSSLKWAHPWHVNSQIRNYLCYFATKTDATPVPRWAPIKQPTDVRSTTDRGLNGKGTTSSVQSFLKMLKIWDNRVHAGFYSCPVIFLAAVFIQEIPRQKHTEQQNISPLPFRLSLWGCPWIFLLFTGIFPSLTYSSFMSLCKKRTSFPICYHIFYFGGRILALPSES